VTQRLETGHGERQSDRGDARGRLRPTNGGCMKTKDVTILEIEGMSSPECEERVATSLRNVEGVRTEEISRGAARIDCDNKMTFHAACVAIRNAGFKIRRAAAPVRVDDLALPGNGHTRD
jgi:copper chaperone CopZ